ncbi:MAG: glycosyltransferase family 9 protein [Leptolyngbyaceae cyanobacterium SM2_5_2]|nr:glycosyltransferase family 9 protein [Leptolyngbyaceae cyanobacterium SM2_5_2]
MRVLALVPGGIERQLAVFPVLSQIQEALAATDIAVVVDPQVKEVYQLSKVVTEVVPYSFQSNNSPADWANLLGIVRDREFEAALTLADSWASGLLLWLSGIPTRVGYAGGANGFFLTSTIPRQGLKPGVHEFDGFLRVLKVAGEPAPLSIQVPQGDLAAVDTMRRVANLGGGYVLVYPGATPTGETYPAASWLPILKDFQQRQPDLPVTLLQTPETVEVITALRENLPNLTVVTPETIGQTAALIAGANLLVSVQGYPLVLAAALGVYALGLSTEPLASSTEADERLVNVVSATGQMADITPEW